MTPLLVVISMFFPARMDLLFAFSLLVEAHNRLRNFRQEIRGQQARLPDFSADQLASSGVQVNADAGGVKWSNILSQQACNYACQDIAGACRGQSGIGLPTNTCAQTAGIAGICNDSTRAFENQRDAPFLGFLARQFQAFDIASRNFESFTETPHFAWMRRNHCSSG